MIGRLRGSVGFLIGLTIIGQLISFVREAIFAYYYGTSYQADAYVMAAQIPITLFAVITTSINTVLLPIYTSKKEKSGQNNADQFMNSFIMIFELLCVFCVGVAIIFAKQIVFFFAPGFNGEQLTLTIRYVQLLFPTIMLSSVINVLTIRFNASMEFSYPQCVGLVQNIAIIVMMLILARSFGTDAVVYGTILGLLVNVVLLAIPSRAIFGRHIEIKGLWYDIKEVLVRVIPVACGVGIAEINRVIDKAIASTLDTGSITGLNYANKLSVVFSALVVTALSTVCFQRFASLYARGLYLERLAELQKYIIVLVYILLPITCGALMLKRELITVVFARGAFGTSAITMTADIFFYYSIGILPIAIREILSKFFYAAGNTRTPMINSAIGVIINIILNIILSKYMGAAGLAFATSISYTVVCLLLFCSILQKERFDIGTNIVKDSVLSLVASLIMCMVLWICRNFLVINGLLFSLLFEISIGILVYFIICSLIARHQVKLVISVLFSGTS